jgi:enamine deaminase RidA (YjgF/YER057c/UK114 family)
VSYKPDQRVLELGLELPDYDKRPYAGTAYGSMKAHHIAGGLLYLSGHVPEDPSGNVVHPGRVGLEVTVEQGYQAARQAGINALAGIRHALGSLNRVAGIVRTQCFVTAAPGFVDVNLVASGTTDLFRDVFGEDVGLGGRVTVGVMSIGHNHCFENLVTVEIAEH